MICELGTAFERILLELIGVVEDGGSTPEGGRIGAIG